MLIKQIIHLRFFNGLVDFIASSEEAREFKYNITLENCLAVQVDVPDLMGCTIDRFVLILKIYPYTSETSNYIQRWIEI